MTYQQDEEKISVPVSGEVWMISGDPTATLTDYGRRPRQMTYQQTWRSSLIRGAESEEC